MWEAPVKVQRTSIGLDVHARLVVGCGLDGDTGEVFSRRLCPDHREVLEWVGSLPAPVAVTYEAGPTGFGLALTVSGAHGHTRTTLSNTNLPSPDIAGLPSPPRSRSPPANSTLPPSVTC